MDLTLEPRVVRGFRFAGVGAGLRKEPGRKDLGLIVADRPVRRGRRLHHQPGQGRAGLSSPQERIRRGRLQAVVANSGWPTASPARRA